MRRINFLVEKSLFDRFRLIPWGQRSLLLRKLVEYSVLMWEIEGHAGLARILDDGPKPSSRVQILNKSTEEIKGG